MKKKETLKEETEIERLNRYKKEILKIIYKKLPKCKVFLFGSRARSDYAQGSDIDLIIDSDKKIDFKIILDLHDQIEETSIPLTVDIVIWQNADDNFKKIVKKERILWKL